jgi:hypothetical protein
LKLATLARAKRLSAAALAQSRGVRLVVSVGQKKAIAIAVRNASGRRGWSKLAEWLRRSTH